MDSWRSDGPWRSARIHRAGLFPFLGLVALGFLAGCGGGGDGSSSQEQAVEAEREALGLPRGAEVHSVVLGGRGAEEHVVPTLVQAEVGDAVEFRTVDHRVHTVRFPPDSLAPEVFSFLEATNQLGSPPLLNRGSRFIVRLRDAPPGRYVFLSDGHGGVARGVIEVGTLPPAVTSGGP